MEKSETIYNIKDSVLTTTTEKIKHYSNNMVCSISEWNFNDIMYYFILPLIILVLLLIIFYYRNQIKELIEIKLINTGFIKVFILTNSKRLKIKIKKLDKFKRFKFRGKSYSLDDMENFIFCFDKNNIPVFLYHINFVIPLTIDKKELTEDIKKTYGFDEEDKEEISAVKMRLDSDILRMIYDKKLLSDLYDASSGSVLREKIVYILIGLMLLIFAYYTGYLDKILSYVS